MRQIRPAGWLTQDRLDSLPDTLFFHAREKLAATLIRGGFRLLGALADHAEASGWGVEVVPYTRETQDLATAQGGHLHIYLEDRPLYAPNAIHAVPSYLRGYWYFDEVGSRNNSTQRLTSFDPRLVADHFAKRFHTRIANQFIGKNFSKFQQVARGSETIAPGCLAFFAQDFQPPRHHRHYLTVPQMIAAAIAAKGKRALYIKPHPNNTPDELAHLASLHAPENGVHITTASIHDLLAACDCALTVTSAVGFEAFLHKKPVVLGGQTDYAQNAITLTNPDHLADAIKQSIITHWSYEKFLTWFLRQLCVEDHPNSLPTILKTLHTKGYGFADAGQKGYF